LPSLLPSGTIVDVQTTWHLPGGLTPLLPRLQPAFNFRNLVTCLHHCVIPVLFQQRVDRTTRWF